jgi:hypothetical protein
MQPSETYINERLDHLGIVAGVCQEIGLASYLDGQTGKKQHHVSVGTATVAMILNGLGLSNRRLYLVPQFFANKPVEHLLCLLNCISIFSVNLGIKLLIFGELSCRLEDAPR